MHKVHVAIEETTRRACVKVLPDPLQGVGLWNALPALRGTEALASLLSGGP